MPVLVHLDLEALNLLKELPAAGPLFPHLSRVRAGDRTTESDSRCRQLGIKGVTLHSYRYSCACRYYPPRPAMDWPAYGAVTIVDIVYSPD